MGMFGQLGKAVLNQAGINLLGVDFAGMKRKRQEEADYQAAMREAGGLMGRAPGAMRQVPVAADDGSDITAGFAPQMEQGPSRQRSPAEMAQGLAGLAPRLGSKMTGTFADLARLGQPSMKIGPDGRTYNENDPAVAGQVFPKLGEGIRAMPGGGSEAVPGYADAAAGIEGAKTGAQEQQKAAYDLVDVPLQDGSTVKIPRLMANQILSKAIATNGVPQGFGRSQPPAAAAAAKLKAESQAGAQITLPTDTATVDAAIASIDALSIDPAMSKRTGLMGVLPAIPGTEGSGFDAQLKQLTGQIFLDAYASLRGAGAITEQEGKAATAAKARLEKAQTEEDFRTALSDLRTALVAGKGRLAQRAGAPAPTAPRARVDLSRIPLADRLAIARQRGLIK